MVRLKRGLLRRALGVLPRSPAVRIRIECVSGRDPVTTIGTATGRTVPTCRQVSAAGSSWGQAGHGSSRSHLKQQDENRSSDPERRPERQGETDPEGKLEGQ